MAKRNFDYYYEYEYKFTDIGVTIIRYIGTKDYANIPEFIEGKPVTAIGDLCFAVQTKITEINLPKTIVSIGVNAFSNQKFSGITLHEGLEEIGTMAFYDCSDLKSIVLPSTLKTIGDSAFFNCLKLKDVTFLNENINVNKSTFNQSDDLENINFFVWEYLNLTQITKVIDRKIKNIGTHSIKEEEIFAFIKSKRGLKKEIFLSDKAAAVQLLIKFKVKIKIDDLHIYLDNSIAKKHSSVTAILLDYKNNNFSKDKIESFDENKELVEIGLELPTLKQFRKKWKCSKVDGGLRILKYEGVNTEEIIPDMLACGTKIVELKRGRNSSDEGLFHPIKKLRIEAKITEIPNFIFANNADLTEVYLPDTITSIGIKAFENCSNLCTINIPDGVTVLNKNTFFNCSSLDNIQLPKSLSEIHSCAFENCSSLENIQLPKSLSEIHSHAFKNCSKLNTINIPDGVTVLNECTFFNCSSLENIQLPKSLSEIHAYAFAGCNNLCTINIPDGVTVLSEYTFLNCSSLENIQLPKSLSEIHYYAFSGCIKLAHFDVFII